MVNKKRLPVSKKAVVLLSGGLDSAVTLYFAKKRGLHCRCLIFDYGQRHKREIEAAGKIAKRADCLSRILNIKLPWRGSSLLDKKAFLPQRAHWQTGRPRDIPTTYVPGRNIIFLSYAVSFAESIRAESIFIGAHAQDSSGYPDCRQDFLEAMERAINLGIVKKGIQIVSPLIDKTKKEIVELGKGLGVPFEYTWSCYLGRQYPCQRCDSCLFRMKAFKSLGLEDPLLQQK